MMPVDALFFGSSNAVPGTWVDEFVTRMGFGARNFSVGGAGSTVGRSFATQVTDAIADQSFDHGAVRFAFVCDLGNDIRATNNIEAQMTQVFADLAAGFPNARIIVLPVVWGNTPLNNNGSRIVSISRRYEELRRAAFGLPVEIIDGSELWLADAGDWMESTAHGASGVHPNPAGHSRIADCMVQYMRGQQPVNDIGMDFLAPKPAIFANYSYWTAGRTGRFASIQGNARLLSAVNIDTELGQLDYGLWPMTTLYVPVIPTFSRDVSGTFAIFENGLVRSLSYLAAGDYLLNATWRVF